MTDNVITANPDSSLYDVAQLMREHNIGFLPIIQDKEVLGVITDRDLAIRGYAEKKCESTTVRDIMTNNCLTVTNNANIHEVADIMAINQIRRVCVTDNGNLIGVCAIGDLAVLNQFNEEAEFVLTQISQPQQAKR